jgi:hypothetical protein
VEITSDGTMGGAAAIFIEGLDAIQGESILRCRIARANEAAPNSVHPDREEHRV